MALKWAEMSRRLDEVFALAIANGTHREGPSLTVCQGCRRWVRSISYVTSDHERLCRDCDPTTPGEKKKASGPVTHEGPRFDLPVPALVTH
jgi:hypothetical protein